MLHTKEEWLQDFRQCGNSIVESRSLLGKNQREKTKIINKKLFNYRDEKNELIQQTAKNKSWTNKKTIEEIMCMTYAFDISMLEVRNKVWPYDYMDFARRIGELWEPFCKLAFKYPIKELKIIDPPSFDQVQKDIKGSAIEYIDSLKVSSSTKSELKKQYAIPWTMVDSGGIRLSLDLHFEQNGINYNCDFKSGFSSNEKGNTNRLLLVASIYNSIGPTEKTLLFVRQKEDENNHYLQTLKNSPYWDVYCADSCYDAIKRFTGFDIRAWLNANADWENDISNEFREHLQANDLLKYLTW